MATIFTPIQKWVGNCHLEGTNKNHFIKILKESTCYPKNSLIHTFEQLYGRPGNHGGAEGVIRPYSYMLLSHAKWDHIMDISLLKNVALII